MSLWPEVPRWMDILYPPLIMGFGKPVFIVPPFFVTGFGHEKYRPRPTLIDHTV